MSAHCPCNKVQVEANQAKDKSEEYKKVKNLKTKNLKAQNLLACDIETRTINAESATFTDLSSISLSVSNLNVTTLNGRNLFCDNEFKISGVITPVQYINGEPIQPDNTDNFDQRVVDELWTLNRLANGFSNLDAADTRYKNYLLQNFYGCNDCPGGPNFHPTGCAFNPVQSALFTGSVTGSAGGPAAPGSNNILNVTEILPANIVTGNTGTAQIGVIQVGQRVYPQNAETYFVIREQLSGTAGGIGTYRVDNAFNSVINLPSQRMLALKANGLEECALIPLRIYGVETIPYSSANIGGMSGMTGMSGLSGAINGCGISVVEAVNYNINIANKVIDTRVALVYLQVGWLDENNQVVIQGLSVDTKQFDLSILNFGEQMNNNFLIPDNINPDLRTAVVQIAVYVEDGLEVLIPEAGTPLPLTQQNSSRAVTLSRDIARVVSVPGQPTNYTVSFSAASAGNCSLSFALKLGKYTEANLIRLQTGDIIPRPDVYGVVRNFSSGYYYYKPVAEADLPALVNIGESVPIGTVVNASSGQFLNSIATTNESFNQPGVGGTITFNAKNFNFSCAENGGRLGNIGQKFLISTDSFPGILYGVYIYKGLQNSNFGDFYFTFTLLRLLSSNQGSFGARIYPLFT